jgi:hypothetical protein
MKLIFKKEDPEKIENYRPISLTTVDYRILAHALANRLKQVIGEVINDDQTAYIPGRYMGENIRLVSDTIDYFKDKNKVGILLAIDFKKAFDSLKWDFMREALIAFNFGPSFLHWIDTLYNSPEANIKNNGFVSETFVIEKGIRQGCPISGLLFVLAVEILANKLRKSNTLKGLHLGATDARVTVSQYADDTVLFLNNKTEICNALNIITCFGNFAGTKLNLSKCEAFWLGSDRTKQRECSLFGFKWPENLRILGIYVGYNEQNLIQLNWYNKIEKVKNLLHSWSTRDLSLFGKVQVVKTFVMSEFVLVASLLPVPKNVYALINKLIFKFLWGGSEKVQRKKLVQTKLDGGIDMIDLRSKFNALKAKWLYRLKNSLPLGKKWALLANELTSELGDIDTILKISIDESTHLHILENLHPFYKEVIKCHAYSSINTLQEFTDNMCDQQLWGNRFVTIKQHKSKIALYFTNWIKCGVVKIADLPLNNGKLDVPGIYAVVRNHTNIVTEIAILAKALQPFTNELRTMVRSAVSENTDRTTKEIYRQLISVNCNVDIRSMSSIVTNFCSGQEVEIRRVFRRQLGSKGENKLKEFTFKVIYDILPCNVNLKKWHIKENDQCDLCCNEKQTIEHLLVTCERARNVWQMFYKAYSINIELKHIVCGTEDIDVCNVVTLLAFILYKEWLLKSLENKCRERYFPYNVYLDELKIRQKINEINNTYLYLEPIMRIISSSSLESVS